MDLYQGITAVVLIGLLLTGGMNIAKCETIGPFNESTVIYKVHRVSRDMYCNHLEPGESITGMDKKWWYWWTVPEFLTLLNQSYNCSMTEFKLTWKSKKNVTGVRNDYRCEACVLQVPG